MEGKKNIPEIRFSGFTDSWEQRKVIDICSISTGKSNTQDRIDNGFYPFYVRSPIIERSNRYLFDEEAVLTVGDGVGTGKVYHYVHGKYDLHQRVYRMFGFNKDMTVKYFYHYFSNHFNKRVMAMTAKTSVDSVRYEMISEMTIYQPLIKEQELVSGMFDNLDNLITLHQRKCDKLKIMKKALLEKMFPKEGEKAPELRFKNFTEDWEQRKLDEIVDIIDGDRGKNYPNDKDLQENGHTLFLSAANVTKNGFKFDSVQYITKYKSNSMGNGKLVIDDIVLTSRGSLGHIAWYNADNHREVPFARINSGMLILRSKSIVSPCIVAQILKSPLGKKQIDFISFGSAQPQLTKKDITNYTVNLPNYSKEQYKIGSIFHDIDNLITLHQRKLDKLNNIKKSLLEKMFV